jgi:hypothetical protein
VKTVVLTRTIVFLAGLCFFIVLALPARAQLAGTDTAPGSSCAGFPAGATRLTADADQNGTQVVLTCDGTHWKATDLPSCNIDEFLVMTPSGWDCYIGGPPGGSDSVPDSFSFSPVTDADADRYVLSNIVLISGIDTVASLLISGDGSPEYRTCSDSSCSSVILNWTSGSSTIQYGRYLQLRLRTPAADNVESIATMTVGTVAEDWSVTTELCDDDPVIYSGAGSFSFSVPSNCTNLRIQVWGGGGSSSGTAGGGGGAYSESSMTVVPGSTYLVHVGAAAGDSYFDSATTVMAKGGTSGGVGGDAASGFGAIKHSGGAAVEGGGGAGGTISDGADAAGRVGGDGGVLDGGRGGTRGTCSGFGTCQGDMAAPIQPGGGGVAGQSCGAFFNCPAYDGANGRVVLTPSL